MLGLLRAAWKLKRRPAPPSLSWERREENRWGSFSQSLLRRLGTPAAGFPVGQPALSGCAICSGLLAQGEKRDRTPTSEIGPTWAPDPRMWRRTGAIGPQFVGLPLLEEQGGCVDRLSGDITAGRGHPAFPRFLQRSGLRGRFSSVSPRPETTEEVLCVCV